MSIRRDPRGVPAGKKPPEETRPARAARAEWRNTAMLYVAVAVGSVIGSVLRYVTSVVLYQPLGTGFPWATLLVNVAGSFVIGLYAALSGPDGRIFASAPQRHFVMTGFCGGFTTFSMFSLEVLRALQLGAFGTAGAYIAASVFGWLAAVWLGHALAGRLNRLGS